MEINELTPDEELVLLGLLREIVQADGEYTPQEQAAVDRVRSALGPARFDQAILKAQDRFTSRAELKEQARAVERPEARRAIYDLLVTVAASDGVAESEEAPLVWLASWWEMKS